MMTRVNTGYKDQDGRDIYLGDILHLSYSQGHERDSDGDIYGNYVVALSANGPCLKMINPRKYDREEQSLLLWSEPDSYMKELMKDGNPYGTRDYRFKIIGNIIDNPELLK